MKSAGQRSPLFEPRVVTYYLINYSHLALIWVLNNRQVGVFGVNSKDPATGGLLKFSRFSRFSRFFKNMAFFFYFL